MTDPAWEAARKAWYAQERLRKQRYPALYGTRRPDGWLSISSTQAYADAITAHTEAALAERDAELTLLRETIATVTRTVEIVQGQIEQREAALAGKEAELEVMDARRGTLGNMLRYIAFVLAGDEAADAQLAADRARTEIDDLLARLATAEGAVTDTADHLGRVLNEAKGYKAKLDRAEQRVRALEDTLQRLIPICEAVAVNEPSVRMFDWKNITRQIRVALTPPPAEEGKG